MMKDIIGVPFDRCIYETPDRRTCTPCLVHPGGRWPCQTTRQGALYPADAYVHYAVVADSAKAQVVSHNVRAGHHLATGAREALRAIREALQ